MEAFIGMIAMFGFAWAPRNWALCNGQLLSISSNQALFSLLGTTYGGDGRTTFALPNLQGRASIHHGQGPGLTPRQIGEQAGNEQNTLTLNQMPSHNHDATAQTEIHAEVGAAEKLDPTGRMLAGSQIYNDPDPADNKVMASESAQTTVEVAVAGGGQPINNMQPFLTVSYCICVQGLYPSRN